MTKPTNEERREIAERLRELADANRGPLGIERVQSLLGETQRILGTRGLKSVAHVIERHADLIEPEPGRTCRIEHAYAKGSAWPHAACSECGGSLSYYDTVDEYGEDSADTCPYCPFCGAKVVE